MQNTRYFGKQMTLKHMDFHLKDIKRHSKNTFLKISYVPQEKVICLEHEGEQIMKEYYFFDGVSLHIWTKQTEWGKNKTESC